MPPKDILLTTLNATYQHCAFGLRYLYANLAELKPQAQIREFTISQNPRDIAEMILEMNPKVVGFGVYIWNTKQTEEVVEALKRVKPELIVILGGPEVSHESEGQSICELADFTLQGEAELVFAQLCRDFLNEGILPSTKLVACPLPEISQIESPYPFYTDEDIRNRVLYVEASRGCPYKCEFCLSSLDKSVRNFPTETFLADMDRLIQRGARQFKFVDRTFNLNFAISQKILLFFLERIHLGLFLHFEMVPDRLPDELKDLIRKFPEGSLQFEIGIQTWNPHVSQLISRRQDYQKVRENFAFLTQETGVHLHADLIVGLPGETLESFQLGFDAVYDLGAEEVQVGILKRLKGTPIARHDAEWKMLYQTQPPFTILQTKTMDFKTIQRLNRFAKFWSLIANSGNFKATLPMLKSLGSAEAPPSLFNEFLRLSDFLDTKHPQRHGIALMNLVESVWCYLTQVRKVEPALARAALIADYCQSGKRDIPAFLRTEADVAFSIPRTKVPKGAFPARQARHLQSSVDTNLPN